MPARARTMPAARRMTRPAAGFTLVELVVVLLLLGVLVGVGASRFASREPFAVQSAADRLVSGLRLAQSMARARRETVHVVLVASPARLQVCLDAACTQPLAAPGGGAGDWLVNADDLQLSTGASFAFGADGAATLASTLQTQVRSADGSAQSDTVTVEAGSGHVHAP